ncbi:E3 ubiquitin-protein ligase RNF8-like isoform X1 [Agrilus planipennis]|uniref:E3 ubiquitin-protein ligase CHFR n=1 Tax=Agrilus planipennis TaxID=224129 RepID=A0A1W4WEU7_AGRPL|nr:E3 ubiquitin-protein ligase RNF8-like isoform X1 [Agrilus planipennis]
MEKAILTNYGTSKAFSTPIVLSNEKYGLGRGLQNDCVFDDVSISRNHCTIEKSGKEWIVIDRSSNGTLVNGILVGRLKAHVLQNGDVVTLGSNTQFQFIKRNSAPEPVTESNKSSLSEEEIINITDATLTKVEQPNLRLSPSLEDEFNIPMDVEGNSNIDKHITNENNSSVKSGTVNESNHKSQLPHCIEHKVNMTSTSDVPKTTLISINPTSYKGFFSSFVINSNVNKKSITLPSISQPSFAQNTLPGATATTSTAIPSWLIGVVSQKVNQQSQKSKCSITKSPKSARLKSSITSPPKTYSNTKKGSKKKSTEANDQPSCSKDFPQAKVESRNAEGIKENIPKDLPQAKDELKNVNDIKEKITKEDTEPKPGCSKSSETKLHAVQDELQCIICTEMFIKAVTLSCSHTFCKFCIDEWKKKKTACPICRAPICSILPTLVIDSFIEKILENADEETKLQRSKLIADRESQQASGSKDYRGKEKSATDVFDEAFAHDAIILSSDSDMNSYDSDAETMSYYDDDSDNGRILRMQRLRNNFVDRVKEHLERSLYNQIQLISILNDTLY